MTNEAPQRSRRKKTMPSEGAQLRVECFTLADSAEEVNGKLYMLGGGWDRLAAKSFPTVKKRLTLPAIISLPWQELNKEHKFEIKLLDASGRRVFDKPILGGFRAETLPGSVDEDEVKLVLSVEIENIKIQREGRYVFVLEIDSVELSRATFKAVMSDTKA